MILLCREEVGFKKYIFMNLYMTGILILYIVSTDRQ